MRQFGISSVAIVWACSCIVLLDTSESDDVFFYWKDVPEQVRQSTASCDWYLNKE